MGERATTGLVAILTAIIGVAIIAVLVSKQAQTASVLTAGGTAFGSILKAAVSPVTSSSGLGSGLSTIGNGAFGLP